MKKLIDREMLVIARRELLERVRSRWFLIGTLLGPIVMLAVILVPAILAARDDHKVQVVIVNQMPASEGGDANRAELNREIIAGFALVGWEARVVEAGPAAGGGSGGATDEAALLAQVKARQINGFLLVPADVLSGGKIIYQGDNGTNAPAMARLTAVVTAVVQHRRGIAAGISDEQVKKMLAPVALVTRHTTGEAAGASGMATFIVGYVVMFILYLAIILYASNVMRSVVQEKTSRVVELMVAAVKPRSLMGGKVAGVGAVGLIQLVVWLGMAVVTMKYKSVLLGMFGVKDAGGISVPPLSLAEVGVILAYFVLGYFLYACVYAAVGAMVSTEQEAQQAQMPVMTLIIIAVACVQLVANDPRGGAAVALTTIPFFSPLLMPMRYLLGGAGGMDLAISLAILLVTMVLTVIAAGRIYRVGILMYGKRPSGRELLRWLRH